MSSYLEIALRVANRIQSVGSEPAAGISQPMGSIVEKSRSEITTQTVIKSGATAACGSSHCAGCYDVGDGRKNTFPEDRRRLSKVAGTLEAKRDSPVIDNRISKGVFEPA